jgi:hypothetical protein
MSYKLTIDHVILHLERLASAPVISTPVQESCRHAADILRVARQEYLLAWDDSPEKMLTTVQNYAPRRDLPAYHAEDPIKLFDPKTDTTTFVPPTTKKYLKEKS